MLMNINIDFNNAVKLENAAWRGIGMVSGNNSSRLLLDYKALYPEKYNELLQLMFGTTGLGVQHLKIEMGSDINSSSGTEPCTMRFADEKPDVTRGAGFILCADAKKINPDITLDMLWWSEPVWIEKSENIYEARYSWYKGNLVEAYKVFGLKFDFVSATQNERDWDSEWIKYLSNRLKTDIETPYDFSRIKIVAGEEVCTWNQAKMMLEDPDLLKAVDVIGSHYTSWSDENVAELQKMGKEIWFSEGSSSMGYSENLYKYDGNGSGLSGLNNVLDVANRIITMYPGGKMTLCEFQPVVAAYYDGVCYCHKQFITANSPWNGSYKLDPGFFMILHFSQFIERGWQVIEEASFGDGKPAGDGHSVGDAVYSYLTCCNPESGDWTSVITNTTDAPIQYDFDLKEKNEKQVFLYETSGSRLEKTLQKKKIETDGNKFTVSVSPDSIITVSTLDKEPVKEIRKITENFSAEENPVMTLPYSDDFSYSNMLSDFLKQRGQTPLFTTDEGGAFEINSISNKNVLVQQIKKEEKAKEWGWTPEPVTNLGDDRWFNYSAEIDIRFDSESCDEKNYAGIGIRYNLPCDGQNGFWVKLCQNGEWSFCRNKNIITGGKIENFNKDEKHRLFISAENTLIRVCINHNLLLEKTTDSLGISMQGGGRVAIFSDYYRNQFSSLEIKPVGKTPYIMRFDNLDDSFEYIQNQTSVWNHGLMESFKCYKRTVSHGEDGAKLHFNFKGTGFNLCGYCEEETEINLIIDDKEEEQIMIIKKAGYREALLHISGLSEEKHHIVMKVLKGKIHIDSGEVIL